MGRYSSDGSELAPATPAEHAGKHSGDEGASFSAAAGATAAPAGAAAAASAPGAPGSAAGGEDLAHELASMKIALTHQQVAASAGTVSWQQLAGAGWEGLQEGTCRVHSWLGWQEGWLLEGVESRGRPRRRASVRPGMAPCVCAGLVCLHPLTAPAAQPAPPDPAAKRTPPCC